MENDSPSGLDEYLAGYWQIQVAILVYRFKARRKTLDAVNKDHSF